MIEIFAAFAKRFARDPRGGILMIFAIALPVLLVMTIGAVDLYRLAVVKQQLQDSLDAATLIAARSSATSDAEADSVGDKAFVALMEELEVDSAFSTFKLSKDNTVTGTASGELTPLILGLFRGGVLDTEVETVVKRAKGSPIEVALVLDTTGSMAGKPILDLKLAAKDLIKKLHKDADPGAVKIAVVPFGQYVNVGISRRNEPWMSVPADYTSTVPYPEVHTFWGCVGSPAYPRNVEDSDASRVYPGFLDLKCGSEITPLTSSRFTADKAIDVLIASGYTYIPSGLAWGFNLLSQARPMTEAAPYDKAGPNKRPRKALVLMTDGANTVLMDAKTGRHDLPGGSLAKPANDYTEELCRNIKAERIEVYTVAFQVDDAGIKTILEGCASGKDHYFDAADAAKLQAAFAEIAESLRSIYIAK